MDALSCGVFRSMKIRKNVIGMRSFYLRFGVLGEDTFSPFTSFNHAIGFFFDSVLYIIQIWRSEGIDLGLLFCAWTLLVTSFLFIILVIQKKSHVCFGSQTSPTIFASNFDRGKNFFFVLLLLVSQTQFFPFKRVSLSFYSSNFSVIANIRSKITPFVFPCWRWGNMGTKRFMKPHNDWLDLQRSSHCCVVVWKYLFMLSDVPVRRFFASP